MLRRQRLRSAKSSSISMFRIPAPMYPTLRCQIGRISRFWGRISFLQRYILFIGAACLILAIGERMATSREMVDWHSERLEAYESLLHDEDSDDFHCRARLRPTKYDEAAVKRHRRMLSAWKWHVISPSPPETSTTPEQARLDYDPELRELVKSIWRSRK